MWWLVGPVDGGEASVPNSIHSLVPGNIGKGLLVLSFEKRIALVLGRALEESFRLAPSLGYVPIIGQGGTGAGIHPRYPH
jgi:hypothetical protein